MSGAADSQAGDYIQAVLAAYRSTPEVVGHVRPADRRMAAWLLGQGVPIRIVEDALLLAVVRRKAGGQCHEPIRSLHYFRPVIEELMHQPLAAGYVDYLRQRLLPERAEHDEPPDAGPEKNGSR